MKKSNIFLGKNKKLAIKDLRDDIFASDFRKPFFRKQIFLAGKGRGG